MLAFAPASSNALAESYSQLVPGNAGMNTFGCTIDNEDFWCSLTMKFIFDISPVGSTAFVGNIGSKVDS